MKWLLVLGFVLGGFETAMAHDVIRCEVNIIDHRSGYVVTRLLDRGRDCSWAFDSCYRTIDYNRLDAFCEEVEVGPIGPAYPSYPTYPTYPYYYPSTTVTVTTAPSVTTTTTTVEEWYEDVPTRRTRNRHSTPRPSTPAPRPTTPTPAPRPTENTGRAPAPGSRGETLPPPPGFVGGRN